MPRYQYACPHCGEFDEWASMEHALLPSACPDCGAIAQRTVSAPRLRVLSPANRVAHERNEKSQHEPMVAQTPTRHRHPGQRIAGLGDNLHSHPTHRPWMIGH